MPVACTAVMTGPVVSGGVVVKTASADVAEIASGVLALDTIVVLNTRREPA